MAGLAFHCHAGLSDRAADIHGLVARLHSRLLDWADVAVTGKADALAGLDLPLADFEDALQVAAAMACGAQFIVTRNERDFRKSPVLALSNCPTEAVIDGGSVQMSTSGRSKPKPTRQV